MAEKLASPDGVLDVCRKVIRMAENGDLSAVAVTLIRKDNYTGTFVSKSSNIAMLIGAVNLTLAELTLSAMATDADTEINDAADERGDAELN